MNVCEQPSPAVTLCPLCSDTLSRNVALSEQRRDNGSLSLSQPQPGPGLTGQLSTAPPSAFISSAPAWPAWHWTSLTGCVSLGGCPVSGSGSDSLHPRVTRSWACNDTWQHLAATVWLQGVKSQVANSGLIQIFEIGLFD